jgi:hypothetical protein
LRERTEPAQAADRDLVTALDDGGNLALDGNAGLGRDGERLPGLRTLAKLVREPDSSPVDTTVASTSSPMATRSLPSASVSSARSIQASPLPPTSTNTLSAEIWMTRPFHDLPDFEDGPWRIRARTAWRSLQRHSCSPP